MAYPSLGVILILLGCTGVFSIKVNASRPLTCLDKFAAVANHTFCLANRTQFPLSDSDRDLIVKLHNDIRANVDPPAADMMKMYYSKMLEEEAQIWAENCVFKHEPRPQRNIPGGMTVGQNIAVTSRSGHAWSDITAMWSRDKTKYHFTYGAAHTRPSHYTQQIWSSTTLIGCGVSKCPGLGYMYVCNYGPGGNGGDISKPYKEAKSGHGGELCPSKLEKNSTLCDCNGTVCNNKGTLDPDTCSCQCSKGPNYSDNVCTLSCSPNSDMWMCGKAPFTKSSCPKYENVPVNCPWMCERCPYIGPNYVEGSEPLPSEKDSNTMPVG